MSAVLPPRHDFRRIRAQVAQAGSSGFTRGQGGIILGRAAGPISTIPAATSQHRYPSPFYRPDSARVGPVFCGARADSAGRWQGCADPGPDGAMVLGNHPPVAMIHATRNNNTSRLTCSDSFPSRPLCWHSPSPPAAPPISNAASAVPRSVPGSRRSAVPIRSSVAPSAAASGFSATTSRRSFAARLTGGASAPPSVSFQTTGACRAGGFPCSAAALRLGVRCSRRS